MTNADIRGTLAGGLVMMAALGAVAGDYVISLSSGTVTNAVIDTDDRVVVQAGSGTVVLQDGNRFGGGVVVSNGYLVADYEASGLKDTHLDLVGTANSRPAIFRPKGATFTAPIAASGAGTIAFLRYAGLGPYDHDLVVNIGGDERILKQGTDGFKTAEFDLGNSYSYNLTFKNTIDLNNQGFTLKNPSSSKPLYFEGAITNSGGGASAQSGNFTYWDGTTVFVGKPGRTVDFYYKKNSKWVPRCGNLIFSNCVVRTHNDMTAGESDVGSTLSITYGGGCDHYADNAWDFFAARVGSKMIVDGGTYDHNLILYLGNNSDAAKNYNLEGNLVITNNGTVKLGTFALHHGSVNQYSGLFSVPNDGKHGDGNEVRIGGFRASDTPQKGAGPCVYNLWDGTFDVSSRVWCHVGSAETGTFNQYGGTASVYHPLLVGYHASGVGTLNVQGGTFNITRTDAQAMTVGTSGTGLVTVASGGKIVGAGSDGVRLAANAGASGKVRLDPLGELTTSRVYGGSGASAFVFNGGTVKPSASTFASAFLNASIGTTGVSPLGGAFDTNGKGDFTFPKALVNAPGTLAHHWTFRNGSLVDTVGGVTAETFWQVDVADECLTLAGGKSNSWVRLGSNLVPTDTGWTCEMWFLQKRQQNFSRLLQCGLTKDGQSFFVSSYHPTHGGWYISFGAQEYRGKFVPSSNVPYHLSFVTELLPSGRWQVTATLRNAETGEVCEQLSGLAPVGWTMANVRQSDGLWIGNGAWGDPDPNIELYEVRLHNSALSQNWLAASVSQGRASARAFAKRGSGRLTLTGANTYVCGTKVEAGTLALAAGATLPVTAVQVDVGATLDVGATAQTVKSLEGVGTVKGSAAIAVTGRILPGGKGTVGTLTLDGATLTSGTLVCDIAADGTCDKLAATGACDLSGLSLALNDMENLDAGCIYTLATAPSFTGRFASASVPGNWRVSVGATRVTLARQGLSVIVR